MRKALVEIDLDAKKVERVVYGNDDKSMTDLMLLNSDIQEFSKTVSETLADSEDCTVEKKEESE